MSCNETTSRSTPAVNFNHDIVSVNWCEFTLAMSKNVQALLSLIIILLSIWSSPPPLLFSYIFPLVFFDRPFSALSVQPLCYRPAAVTSLGSSALKGTCLSVPTSSSDVGSEVKRGQSCEGAITAQLLPHSATTRPTEQGQRRWSEQEKMTPPHPHPRCSRPIVLAVFISFRTSPPSVPVSELWLKGVMTDRWQKASFCVSREFTPGAEFLHLVFFFLSIFIFYLKFLIFPQLWSDFCLCSASSLKCCRVPVGGVVVWAVSHSYAWQVWTLF